MGKRKRRDNYGRDNFPRAGEFYGNSYSEPAEELPKGIHHYRHVGEVPWDIQKYFHQRHSIFSRYDEGIWMTDDAWYGVTPEPVATKIAEHLSLSSPASKTILIDPFAGAGGNVIAFALSDRWEHIYAIEKDPKVLACAKNNATVYGVEDRIRWFEGDCFEVLNEGNFREFVGGKGEGEGGEGWKERSVVFGSPPWGGPGYRTDAIFNLSHMQPYNLTALIAPFRKLTKEVALYLPRTSDLRQLAKVVVVDSDEGGGGGGGGGEGEEGAKKKATVVYYCMEGASKALCVYFGGFDLEGVV
ncbi:MAG: hypothetical protein MMC33_006061 [Icmadophila ericetorum]|nr:hypothetical protein [Icmadophila ericetorum]